MQHLKQIYIFPWYYNTNKISTQELQASQWHLYEAQLILHQNLSLLQHVAQTTIIDTINLKALLYDIDTSQCFLYMAQKRQHSFYLAKLFLGTHKYFVLWKIQILRRRKPVNQFIDLIVSEPDTQPCVFINKASISSVHSKPSGEIYTQHCQYGMVSHGKVGHPNGSSKFTNKGECSPLHVFTLTFKIMTSIWANNLQNFIKPDQLMFFSPETTSEEEYITLLLKLKLKKGFTVNIAVQKINI